MTDRRQPGPANPNRDAVAAWRRGQAALAAGDPTAALRWLDRAARIAPGDLTIALGLATVCLRRDTARAAVLFQTVAAARDVREAWLGLAVARLDAGDTAGAAAALAWVLSRHIVTDDADVAAEAITRAAGAPGWCAVAGDRRLRIVLAHPARALAMMLDGTELRVAARGRRLVLRLPAAAARAGQLRVLEGGRDLIGSPADLAAIRRTEGCVECRAGGLSGWAWHPADPDADPVLQVRAANGRGAALTLRATDVPAASTRADVLARPRGFHVPQAALAGLAGPLRVTGCDGRDLLGSPLDPGAEGRAAATAARAVARRFPAQGPARRAVASDAARADAIGATASGTTLRRRGISVIVPVHGGGQIVLDCLHGVLATIDPGVRVIVVDDASREPDLTGALDRLAADRRIRLVRNRENRGFPRSANAGLQQAAGRDVVLLNSDTLTPPLWLERLSAAAYAAPDIGTACPLSNDATILSYPDPSRPAAAPDREGAARLACLAWRANRDAVVDIPTAVGSCLFIRRDCLDAVGLLREDVFAQGYGEENDFSVRARHLGWRHVAALGAFVAHRGAGSFGGARVHLMARNATVLERLHPGYHALIADFRASDPLTRARRNLDALRWRQGSTVPGRAASVLLVSHDAGGGVERRLAARCAALRAEGIRPIVLRPAPRDRRPDGVVLADGVARDFPNLRFALPDGLAELAKFLRRDRPARVEFHHLLGHDPALLGLPAALGIPHVVFLHDFGWFCPRLVLVGGNGRYCGEPDIEGCETCVADHGRHMPEEIPIAGLRSRSARFLRAATRIEAPSRDAAERVRRHFPGLAVEIVPHEPDPPAVSPPRQPLDRPVWDGPVWDRPTRVCVVGAIGVEKGYDVLLALARDAARRQLPLEFVVVGHTIDDERLMATGRVFVTGPYEPEEVEPLIRAQNADLGLLPSVAPETWCFTLTETWRAGLDVAAFDIGAQAERIRRTGRGWLLPLGLGPAAINDTLLAAARRTRHECADQDATRDCVFIPS